MTFENDMYNYFPGGMTGSKGHKLMFACKIGTGLGVDMIFETRVINLGGMPLTKMALEYFCRSER